MIREWYTAQEFADMALPGVPHARFAFDRRAKKEAWLSRTREGRGGGREYSVHSLPPAAYAAWIKTCADYTPVAQAIAASSSAHSGACPALGRRDAKGYMVDLLLSYARASCVTISRAEALFSALYHKHRESFDTSIFSAPIQATLGDQVSSRSLRRWRLSIERREKAHLHDRARTTKRGESGVLATANDGEVASYIGSIIVTQPQLGPGHIRDLTRAKFGTTLRLVVQGGEVPVPLPKIRSFERFVSWWKDHNAQLYLKMTNPDGYKNKYQIALGSQSHIAHGLNAVWEIDASPVDALCVDGRYTIYAIIDVWSRRSLFFASKTPKTEASLQMIRRAIMAWGVPEMIKTDNGSDFTSHRFRGALISLGIEQKLCPPYTPEGKPHVERVIKTIQHNLMPILPGYVGHNVAERSQITARKSFAQKLGVDDSKAFAVSLDHHQLQDCLDRWAEHKYAHRPHRGLGGVTPFEKYSSWTGEIRRIQNESALALLLAPIAGGDGWRTITKKALRIDGRQYHGPSLELHIGKRVMVRHNPADQSKVYVFDEDGAYLCEAQDYMASPDDNQATIAQEARLGQKKTIQDQARSSRRDARDHDLSPEEITQTLLNQAEEDRASLVEMPRPSVPYDTTSLDSASEAVGAEDRDVLSFPARPATPQAPTPIKTIKEQDEDEWWERRLSLYAAEALGTQLTEREVKWLEWYEARAEFVVREHFRVLREAELSGERPEDLEDI